jgi:hypothetical protein
VGTFRKRADLPFEDAEDLLYTGLGKNVEKIRLLELVA